MKRLRDILPILLIAVGLAVLAYPTVSNFLVERNASRVVSGYGEAVDALSDEEAAAMMDAAQAYNAQLAGLAGVPASEGGSDSATSAEALAEQYNQLLNLNGDGMMGYITIPRLDETLPIYHGTEEAVLQVAVGHIQTSSLPVGGASTHVALSGHRGLPSAKLFTDLDQMAVGDVFYIKVLKTTLAYQVDQILTVLPDQTESLNITAGDDYVTLVTCTPYGINSHRLLVRGHAIPYTPQMDKAVGAAGNPINIPLPYLMLMVGLAAVMVILVVARVVTYRRTMRRRRELACGVRAMGDAAGAASAASVAARGEAPGPGARTDGARPAGAHAAGRHARPAADSPASHRGGRGGHVGTGARHARPEARGAHWTDSHAEGEETHGQPE